MAARTGVLKRLVRLVLFVLVLIVGDFFATLAPFSPVADGLTASASGSEHHCSSQQFRVSVTEGIGGAGHFSWVILATNRGPTLCVLMGYPDVELLSAHGIRAGAVGQTPMGFSGGLPPGVPIPSITLQRGEVASAVMEGTDIPPGTATGCPSYSSYAVTLPGHGATVKIDQSIGSCSGLTVHPFVIGFNGTVPTGEVVGLAPACQRPAGARPKSIGPLVQIDAWSGSELAASVGIAPSRTRTTPYRLILQPGRYRIHSEQNRSSVYVLIHAGQVVRLGLYGTCMLVTLHSIAGVPTTTST
jgi:hypothetical protein